MEPNKDNFGQNLFQFDKNTKKHSKKAETRAKERTKDLFNGKNAEDLKRKRPDPNVALRKEVKKNKFAKRRNLGQNMQTEVATRGAMEDKETFTVEQAESAWNDEMDIMDYFNHILSNTVYQLPHFLVLIEKI